MLDPTELARSELVTRLNQQGQISWLPKSFVHNKALTTLCLLATSAGGAAAQTNPGSPAQPGISFEQFRDTTHPLTDGLIAPFYGLTVFWQYLMDHPPATVLLSAVLAAIFTFLGIRNQRATTRLRETFATINDDNWDKDVIQARETFGEIKREVAATKESITKYVANTQAPNVDLKKVVTLQTILNDYENLALGVRKNIVDEEFLYRWMRTALLDDWFVLSPLVTAYRHSLSRPNCYIEFEGLAASWANSRSYRNGHKLKTAYRKISVT